MIEIKGKKYNCVIVYDARIHNHKKMIEELLQNVDFFELKVKVNLKKNAIVREEFISNKYSKRIKNIEGLLIFEHGELNIENEEKVDKIIENKFMNFYY